MVGALLPQHGAAAGGDHIALAVHRADGVLLPVQEIVHALLVQNVGNGDGGGGPSYSMLETARRMKKMDGMPETTESSVSDFMKKLKNSKLEYY